MLVEIGESLTVADEIRPGDRASVWRSTGAIAVAGGDYGAANHEGGGADVWITLTTTVQPTRNLRRPS
ncbi:hypothetical protein ABZ746_28430 [Streptomyces sp. NPDC020096]